MSYQFNTTDILITQLGDEGVAFNSTTNEYFSLNETSFKILKGIENNVSIEDIRKQLASLWTCRLLLQTLSGSSGAASLDSACRAFLI